MGRRCIRLARTRRAKVSGLSMADWVAWARHSNRKVINATAIWMRTAFSLVPTKWRIFRVCLTQRKNSSMA